MMYRLHMFHLTDSPAKGRKIVIFHPNSTKILKYSDTAQEAVQIIDEAYRKADKRDLGAEQIIYRRKWGKKWSALVVLCGESKYLGYFRSKIDAMKAIDDARMAHYDFDLVNTFLNQEKAERLQRQEVQHAG